MKTNSKLIVIVFLVIAAVFVRNGYLKYKEKQELEDYRIIKTNPHNNIGVLGKKAISNDELAYAAQQYVLASLKSPSTSEFPALFKSKISKLENKTYSISSHVDSENGFGAMIRSNYVVELDYLDDGKIKLVNIYIE